MVENKCKDIFINKCYEFVFLIGCLVFLKIVDNECKKLKIYVIDDIYYEFMIMGIQFICNEKRCYFLKEMNVLKEVLLFNGEMLFKFLLFKVRKEINVKVNVILLGQLKFFFIFYEEISLVIGNIVFVIIGDQEIDLIGEVDISEIFGKFLQVIDE